MIDAGIAPNSILVVDRAIEAVDGDIVVARLTMNSASSDYE